MNNYNLIDAVPIVEPQWFNSVSWKDGSIIGHWFTEWNGKKIRQSQVVVNHYDQLYVYEGSRLIQDDESAIAVDGVFVKADQCLGLIVVQVWEAA